MLLRQVFQLVIKRSDTQCSFLIPPPLLQDYDNIRVIYRRYATLYFVFIVDQQESELGILDLIQVFVQVLNRCFKNVCELDLVFHWQVLEAALEEIIQGGMVIDTNITKIIDAIDAANQQEESSAANTFLGNQATSGFLNRFGIHR